MTDHNTVDQGMRILKHLPLVTVITLMISALAQASSRPNIIYFYVDDMGWGSIGPNGQAERRKKGLPFVKTPNIDRMAASGVNFSRGYGCHVCSPARSSQQTGFHQGHTFADRNDPDNAKKAIRKDDITMGDALAAAGYTTGYWGKWGYGASKEMSAPEILNIQTLPTSHGYQYVLAELHHVRAHTFFQPTLWSAPAKTKTPGGLELIPNDAGKLAGNNAYPTEPAFHNHPKYPKPGYCDDAYAFAALDFVRQHGVEYNKSGTPFFALFAAQIPHAPFKEIQVLPHWDDAYKDDKHFESLPDQARQWAAMVTRIDGHFGNILDALEDPNQDGDTSDSIAANTLVIFQSDNGGPGGRNNSSFDANGGLSGTKNKIQEGGIRVPLVMTWPAMINASSSLKSGSTTDRVVDVTDLLPTFCELAGVLPPVGVDGVSIAPLLTGKGIQRNREFIIHEAGNGKSIIRGKHKLVLTGKGYELYNLVNDPAEKRNIAGKNKSLVKELAALLLGERVDEPKGFANSYHFWMGKEGEGISKENVWSDYTYENAGITYFTDAGKPNEAWIAHLFGRESDRRKAIADKDLSVLAIAVHGPSANAVQEFEIGEDKTVHGRNEVRVGPHGLIELNGGVISSMRWLDIVEDGCLTGHGTIDADLYIDGKYQPRIVENGPSLSVKGAAVLSGKILPMHNQTGLKHMNKYLLIKASSVTGKFDHPEQVMEIFGKKYRLSYTADEVWATLVE